MTLILSIIGIVFLFILFLCVWDVQKPQHYPPGPKWFPLIGNFSQYRKLYSVFGYHHLVWKNFSKTYGPVVGLRLGRNLVVAVNGVKAVKEVLTRDEFNGRPDGFFFRVRTFGKRLGIVFSEGQLWQKQRKFSVQHLRNFGYGKREMESKIIDESVELVELFRKNALQNIEMHNIFDISVLNVLWVMMAGERFSLDDVRLKKLLELIHELFRIFDMSGGLLNQMPFVRHFLPEVSGYSRLVKSLNKLQTFLRETVFEHQKSHCNSHSRDLIDAFLKEMNVTNVSNFTFTDEQLLSLCLDLLMAGSETTSNTLSFAMLYMLEHPGVQKKVQKELDEIVGRNRWPTMQDKISLPYTDAVLMEVQRIVNVPPLGIAHRATRNATLFGYEIPEGTTVLTSLYSVHMDKQFWKDPFKFKPERFLDHNGTISIPEDYFIPFGYGKRSCLGKSLAQTNYFIFFTAVLHNFILKKEHPGEKFLLEGYDGVTISPKPFKAILEPRYDE